MGEDTRGITKIPATTPGSFHLSLSSLEDQPSVLNRHHHRRIRPDPRLFQPVILQVQAGYMFVIHSHFSGASDMLDIDVPNFIAALRFGNLRF